jgi:DNA-binding IclR family transcriptional regulator
VDRALAILELITTTHAGLTLAELKRRLRLPRSSTHCLLVTLERRGYLLRDQISKRYAFSLGFLNMAARATSVTQVQKFSEPALGELAKGFGMIASLAIFQQNSALLLAEAQSGQRPFPVSRIGRRLDLHCTASGKVLLAYMPDEERQRLLGAGQLRKYNENTIVSSRKILVELERIRKMGYSFEGEENELDVCGVGAPVFDLDGRVIAAAGLTGSRTQMRTQDVMRIAQAVKRTAVLVSQRLAASCCSADELPLSPERCVYSPEKNMPAPLRVMFPMEELPQLVDSPIDRWTAQGRP